MTRVIKETKSTCLSCGKIWHYGKEDVMQNTGAAMQNLGKAMMCCTGCFPALLIPDKKTVNLSKCPECGSAAVKTEAVEHVVE